MSAAAVAPVPVDRLLELSGGRCLPSRAALPDRIDPCTDTRALRPGQVFVALVGESFDGHAFVAAARDAGARAAVVSRAQALPAGFPGIVVEDTTRAYLACAEAAREQFPGRVVAITGSVGKTTTKEFCRVLLEAAGLGPVLATLANENNEIGVGHLMLRALRSEPAPGTLVVEMGARHVGEISELARAARPDVGILTGVGESHLENFPSLEALRETKWGLFDFGARPVLNAHDEASLERLERVRDRGAILCSAPATAHPAIGEVRISHAQVKSTHAGASDVRHIHANVKNTQFTENGVSGDVVAPPSAGSAVAELEVLVAAGPGADREIDIHYREPGAQGQGGQTAKRIRARFDIPGAHHRLDLALALAAVVALGGDPERAAQAIPQLALPEGRYQAIQLPNGVNAVYDAYNAAPASTEAALRTFAGQQPAKRKIAVLASMAELGPESEALHRRVGEIAGGLAKEHALDAVLVGGDFAAALEEGALAGGAPPQRLRRFGSNAEAAEWLRGYLHPGDAVLLKGSRRYKMEEILEGLRR